MGAFVEQKTQPGRAWSKVRSKWGSGLREEVAYCDKRGSQQPGHSWVRRWVIENQEGFLKGEASCWLNL